MGAGLSKEAVDDSHLRWDSQNETCTFNISRPQENLEEYLPGLKSVHKYVKRAEISRNALKRVPPIFGRLPILKSLSLCDNEIRDVDPKVFADMKELKSLDLSYNVISSVEPAFFEHIAATLTELHMKVNQLHDIPQEDGLCLLTALETLSLSHNHLSSLSVVGLKSLRNFEVVNNQLHEMLLPSEEQRDLVPGCLQRIDAQGNRLVSLPPNLHLITSLTRLNFGHNQLRELPPEIGLLVNLTELDITNNAIEVLPNEIGNLTSLLQLKANQNALRELPADFTRCIAMNELHLNENRLQSLPSGFGHMVALGVCNLDCNNLTRLPEDFRDLPVLGRLCVRSNALEEFPAGIGTLERLVKLDLSYNCISEVPDVFGQLSSLRELSLGGNPIRELPPSFAKCTGLKAVALNCMELRAVPSVLLQLSGLEHLYLGCNRICGTRADEEESGERSDVVEDGAEEEESGEKSHDHIRVISLGSNWMKEIPDFVGQCGQLRELHVACNKLTQLPSTLSNLTCLHASGNALKEISEEVWKSLQSLEELDLSNNQIEKLSPLVGELSCLTILDVCDNEELSELPNEITKLQHLGQLKIGNCNFTELPEFLSTMENLTWVSAEGNPLKSIPHCLEKVTSVDVMIRNGQTSLIESKYLISRSEMRGWRPTQEDTLSIDGMVEIDGEGPFLLVSVFDGHRGSQAAQHAAVNFGAKLHSALGTLDVPLPTVEPPAEPEQPPRPRKIRRMFSTLQRGIAKRPTQAVVRRGAEPQSRWKRNGPVPMYHSNATSSQLMEDAEHTMLRAFAKSYYEVHADIVESGMQDGCTSLSAAIGANAIYVANAGDARAVLCRGGRAERISVDHKADEFEERSRIQTLPKGFVLDSRVTGDIAVARSLGDAKNQPYLTCAPFMQRVSLESASSSDDDSRASFVILACDGVWDVVSDQQAVDAVLARIQRFEEESGIPFEVAKGQPDVVAFARGTACELRDIAYQFGSRDNISVVVIFLP